MQPFGRLLELLFFSQKNIVIILFKWRKPHYADGGSKTARFEKQSLLYKRKQHLLAALRRSCSQTFGSSGYKLHQRIAVSTTAINQLTGPINWAYNKFTAPPKGVFARQLPVPAIKGMIQVWLDIVELSRSGVLRRKKKVKNIQTLKNENIRRLSIMWPMNKEKARFSVCYRR